MDTASSLASLPERFKGSHRPGRYRLEIGDVARDVVISRDRCSVEPPAGEPDVTIRTDASTWYRIDLGRLSGIEAFADRSLSIRGSIEQALHFETSFSRPAAGGVSYEMSSIRIRRMDVSALIAGSPTAEPLVLVHGLGATKASWLTVVPSLARRYRVIALDLPGFGASSKPRAPYDAPWFAHQVFATLDRLGIERARVAGNSMGGRIAMEMALRSPERVAAIACLCPATAFTRRPALRLVKLLRPELIVAAGVLPRKQVLGQLRALFADPSCVEPEWYDAAIDEFLQNWRSPRARIAFMAAARRIYLEEGNGDNGLWARLRKMETPALYVYGRHDVLITHHFARKIRANVGHARVEVWKDCGHVPQIEYPQRTVDLMTSFFARAERAGRAGAGKRRGVVAQ